MQFRASDVGFGCMGGSGIWTEVVLVMVKDVGLQALDVCVRSPAVPDLRDFDILCKVC